MKVTIPLFTVITVVIGASGVFAQNYISSPTYAPSASYYASDAAAIDARFEKIEAELKKKQNAVDTKTRFSANLRGRVFTDAVMFGDPSVKSGAFAGPGDFVGFRDARIGVSGNGFEILDYTAELAYERNALNITDVFMGVKNVPGLDYVRVGHYKVETGISQLTSGTNGNAMERATPVSVFGPSRRLGAGQTYYFADDQVRWFNGIFAARSISSGDHFLTDGDTETGSGMIYNTRFSMVPFYDKGGERFFHIGGHYMYMEKGNQSAATFSPPNSPRIGGFSRAGASWYTVGIASPTDRQSGYNQGGLEMAWGHGPLGITTELFAGSFGNGRDMYGGYVEVRYFLTKDATRLYDKRNGRLGNVKMKNNFLTGEECFQTHHHGAVEGFSIKSWGAWEVHAQFGFTDSDRVYSNSAGSHGTEGRYNATGGLAGGRTVDTVFGLNWYWNPNTRVMFEYVHSDGTAYRTTRAGSGTEASPYTYGSGSFRASEDIFATSLRFSF